MRKLCVAMLLCFLKLCVLCLVSCLLAVGGDLIYAGFFCALTKRTIVKRMKQGDGDATGRAHGGCHARSNLQQSV